MSIDATRWVWKLSNKIITPTEKLILLSLADRADEDLECWPSKVRLQHDTGFDIKTIYFAIKSLKAKNIIQDTGKRKGKLNRIVVYKFLGLKGREQEDSNHTDNGIIENSNHTDNGMFNHTDNGMFNHTEIGMLNLTVESKRKDIYISDDSKKLVKSKKLKSDELNTLNPHKIPEEMISDWIENRKAKKAPVTQTVWNRINTELGLCSNPIEAFEEMVCRGWVTLKAEWIKSTMHLAPTKTFYDTTSTSWIEGIEQDLL
jgi:hypothetical protein